jgi:hypothetical protein
MNIPKAIEQAFAAGIRKRGGELGACVVIRCWQSLADDASWKRPVDRQFPMLDIRCTPPESDDVQRTMISDCSLLCATKTDDDKDHSAVSALYGAVQDYCDRLFAGAGGDSGAEAIYTEFNAELAARIAEQEFEATGTATVGGITFGPPLAPYDDDGVNMIGIVVRVHYSRSEF